MDLQIRIESGAVDDYVALADWLNGDRDFRGHVRQVTGPPAEGALGDWIEMLTVAVGSGGLGVSLTASLNTWLSTRQRDLTAKVTVTPEGRTVELHARNPNTRELELLGQILRDADER
ncbi:effector-associated constant component EACC1 [Amycolatopsis sp. WGS_07]|uniref:effector-associated constant component EACC1 n=1 Tax=Amycolatopsis sp. WGS_07 TaxID=3076764 RepID=UPI0038739D69